MVSKVDLSVKIANHTFKNPVMSASGTFGYGTEFGDFFDPSILGGVVLKGVSVARVEGNPSPRIYETTAGMINAIGLQNVGIDIFLKEKAPQLEKIDSKIIANIWGRDVKEYIEIAERMDSINELDALELNISCPNIKKGGIEFGVDPEVAGEMTSLVRRATGKDLWVKLSPSASNIGVMAKAVQDAGADAISLINSIPAMAIDVKRRKPRVANVIGGLSGPAIKPIAIRMVYQAAKAVDIPIIGIGGIMSAMDALEFMIAGASAVQVGTAGFVNPHVFEEIIEGIEQFCLDEGIENIKELIGSIKV
jgi:dihydroorotate dehydrogenase (NAD+) catalytic subunit